ncbi:unnamed protein product [Lymnaea stagnalis]|uniref:Deoxyribonuclease n=1 Tax=Lymnaea stagnalis TaxID=6523 RepID=A0AAV2HC65_LYMST
MPSQKVRLCFLAVCIFSLTHQVAPITVGAFNIQHYGDTKQTEQGHDISRVLSHYDIVLIQEVRDPDHSALNELKNLLGSTAWDYVSSNPVGRTASYKEQYVFFYKKASVRVLGNFQYDDSGKDVFEREPYAVNIQYTSASRGHAVNVVLMGIHTQPDKASDELHALPTAMTAAKAHFPSAAGVIAMGDFNADCSYLNNQEKATLPLFHDAKYRSLIADTVDTTTATTTDCAYDRIVIEGNADIVADSAKVYRFDTALGLNYDSTRAISDHYPVEFRLN